MGKPLIVYNNVPTFNNGRPIFNPYLKLWAFECNPYHNIQQFDTANISIPAIIYSSWFVTAELEIIGRPLIESRNIIIDYQWLPHKKCAVN